MSIVKVILEKRKKIKGEDPCWDNYKMVGLKPNGDPRCVGPVKEETLPAQTKMKHRFLVTYSDPKHTMVSKRKEKMQKHVLAPTTDKEGRSVFKGDAMPLVRKHLTNQGYKVHDIEHVGMVSKIVKEEVSDMNIEEAEEVQRVTEGQGAYMAAVAAMPAAAYVGAKLGNMLADYQDKKRKEKAKADIAAVKARRAAKKSQMKEEQITELKTTTLQSYLQKRNDTKARASSAAATIFKPKDSPEVKAHAKKEAGIDRARKKLALHNATQAAERAKKQKEELKKNNPPHEVAKKMAAAKKEYEQSYGPIEKSGHQYSEGNGYYRGKELHQKYHTLKALHKTVSEEVELDEVSKKTLSKYIERAVGEHGHYNMARRNTTGDQQKEFARKETKRQVGISKAIDKLDAKQKVTEATSAAVRMQRALQKAKEERERRERLAKPFVDSIFKKKQEQKPMKEQKTFKEVMEAQLHPDALHVVPTKVDGKTKYKVHAVGKNFADGIKVGEHLTDTHLDDAAEMGARIKQVKSPNKMNEEGSWFGKKNNKKAVSASVSITSPEHKALETRGERNKGEGTEESVNYTTKFAQLLSQHGYQQKLVEWHQAVVTEEEDHIVAIKNIKKNIETRKRSSDEDTDVIRDYDADDVRKVNKPHHKKMKNFRTYFEDVSEAISARQALSSAADMEFKAANTDSPEQEQALKGKAKALRRAARLAQELASTVNIDTSKTK